MTEDRENAFQARAKELGALEARFIAPERVVVAEWVRWKCQFGCQGYGGRLTCPPFSPTPDQTRSLLQGYSKALLVHGEKSFFARYIISQLEREAFLAGYYKAFGMGAGPCRLCEECVTSDPCRHSTEARPSMEACGIDVFQTVRDSGFNIHVLKDREERGNYFGLLLLE